MVAEFVIPVYVQKYIIQKALFFLTVK